MKALRCDRCGRYYRPDESEDETAFIPRITWRNAKSVKAQSITRAREDVDLCSGCAGDLDKFLSNELIFKEGISTE